MYLQIAAENLNKQVLNVVEILSDKTSESNYNTIKNIGDNIPGIKTKHSYVIRENILKESDKLDNADLVLITNLSGDEKVSKKSHYNYTVKQINTPPFLNCITFLRYFQSFDFRLS